MTVKLVVVKKPFFLHVKIKGHHKGHIDDTFLKDIKNTCEESGYSKILLDVRELTKEMSLEQQYVHGKDIAVKFPIYKSIKVASLCRPDQVRSHSGIIAISWGANNEIFTNMKKAVDWLQE